MGHPDASHTLTPDSGPPLGAHVDEVGPQPEPQPRTWYATNLVGVPAWVLGSPAFNRAPRPLHIVGTREAHAGLFKLLAGCDTARDAAEVFMHYLSLAFGLQADAPVTDPSEARRWRASYIRLLQGWGGDSNGPAGAVLKGWVESRFGLVPCHHKGLLGRFPSPAWIAYLEEKATSRFHSNCILQQLDLLYEYCQWTLARFQPFGSTARITLWRGVQRLGAHRTWPDDAVPVVHAAVHAVTHAATDTAINTAPQRGAGQGAHPGSRVLRFNNLLSFALDPRQAECFGDTVLKVAVPLVKLLYYPGLLPGVPLTGESEVLALGGDMVAEVWRD